MNYSPIPTLRIQAGYWLCGGDEWCHGVVGFAPTRDQAIQRWRQTMDKLVEVSAH